MDARAAEEIFLFEGFRLDRGAGGLFHRDDAGSFVPVATGARALDLLILLVRRRGDLVSREEILSAVWPGMTVGDSNLPTQIWALRRVLDRGRANRSCIQTVARRGYRFVAEVAHPAADRRSTFVRLAPVDSTPQSIVAPHLSLVVLPFKTLSDNPGHQCFAERITDDLTTDLSRFTGMRVISRSTASTYRNRPVAAKQIGRELGVRYILEGSIHPSANHVRVNAQLIDAQTDMHLWAERFDCDAGDLFGAQDGITKRAAVGLYTELICTEASRPTEDPDAYKYIFQGRALQFKPMDRQNWANVVSLFERALALDPHSAEAQGWLAHTLVQRALDEVADAPAADIARAAELAARVLAASPRRAFTHLAKGQVLRAQGQYKEALLEYETASAMNPDWPGLYAYLSDGKLWTGSVEDAIPLAMQAIQISPDNPEVANWYFGIGRTHLVQARSREALAWLEKTCSANSGLPTIHAWLASACALDGEIERARSELGQARLLNRDGRYSSISRLKELGHLGVPKVRAMLEDTFFAGLRKAGMPEE
ncbi:MAG: winged helix-turn-helix domain-containing protein [Alphaproteobacteria bacterium]|nr:winged helix-turn-helix domain-containing protein [Alphaproteobacteria bacterium]